MNTYYDEFKRIIESENREKALTFILDLLHHGKLSIIAIYEELLTPVLNELEETKSEDLDIWKEHVRSSIIRTIIENCYMDVIKQRDETYGVVSSKRIAVICPPEEHHHLGARMIKDYFTLLGYESIFVGSNTPQRVFIAGLKTQNLDYIAISITNPYHLISTRNTIENIREIDNRVKIIVGGNAIKKLGDKAKVLKADYYLTTYEDIIAISGGELK